MTALKGPRAATRLLSGRAWDIVKPQKICGYIESEILQLAEQYRLCSAKGVGGMPTYSEYIREKMIEDIRKEEKKRNTISQD